MNYPKHLLQLIEALKQLPGVGNKTAERYAFHMMEWDSRRLDKTAELISEIPDKLKQCGNCGCLVDDDRCAFCNSARKERGIMCVIASAKDVFAIEQTHQFQGVYQVLGSLISPLEGKGPDLLPLDKMKERIRELSINEVVIALDSTLEGDATSLYLKRELEPLQVDVSRLALGLPMGSSLDYVDGGTLARAFSGRAAF